MLKQMHYLDEYRHRKLNKLMKELYVITRVDSMKLRRSMSFASLLGNNKKQ